MRRVFNERLIGTAGKGGCRHQPFYVLARHSRREEWAPKILCCDCFLNLHTTLPGFSDDSRNEWMIAWFNKIPALSFALTST